MKKDKRCGGKSVTVHDPIDKTKIRVKVLADVQEAITWMDKGYKNLMAASPKQYSKQFLESGTWKTALRMGMPERMEAVMAKAEELITEAIEYDPRLVRRTAFRRSDDPSAACGFDAGAIAAGDESPDLSRPKRKLNSQRAHGECVRIVLSTDTKEITDEHAAAFIAAAKLAQQYRPLNIIWQGAWLRQVEVEGYGGTKYQRTVGTAFLVPILNGDLDFSRIQFVLSHANRDNLSHKVAWGISAVLEEGKISDIAGGRATGPLQQGVDFFVPESGINPWGSSVAQHAAQWAGFEYKGSDDVDPRCAIQVWDPKAKEPAKETEADKAAWKKWEAENKARMEKSEQERMSTIE